MMQILSSEKSQTRTHRAIRSQSRSRLVFAICGECCGPEDGRFTGSRAATTPIITYIYDETTHSNGIGRLTSVSETAGGATVTGNTAFDYDVRGHVTKTVKVIEGSSFTTQQTFDSANRIETLTYPDGEVLTQTYDFASTLKTVTGVKAGITTSYVTGISYDAFGHRRTMSVGNGTTTTYTYDPNAFRLQQLATTAPGSLTLQNLSYVYDAVGNVKTITDGITAGNGQSFGYDDLSRLTSATSTGTYGTMTYAYNQIGNMTCNSQLGPCTATSPNYAYPPSGATAVRPHAVNQAGPNTYVYDANGNMTSGAGRTLAYDINNRPTTITAGGVTATMTYDYTGERVSKRVGATLTTYVSGLYECAASCTKYVFAGATRVALKSGTQVLYFHGNHLGSTHLVTDTSGAKVEEILYYPYGATWRDTGSLSVPQKYTGQELDSETGLYYYHARYYDPSLGRFIQADIAGVNLGIPQSLNRYSYVLNNPMRFVDPTGFQACNTDTARNTICMGTTGPIIFPPDPTAPAIMGTPDGTFTVGRGDAIRDFQQALEREANPGTANQWLPSWQQPVGGRERSSGSCGGLSVFGCFSRDLFSPSTTRGTAEVDPKTIAISSGALTFSVNTAGFSEGSSISVDYEVGLRGQFTLSGDRPPNFQYRLSQYTTIVQQNGVVQFELGQQQLSKIEPNQYLRFGPPQNQHPNGRPNPFITDYSQDCAIGKCQSAYQYGFGPSGQ